MDHHPIQPTNIEHRFGDDEIIVSKTDPRGWITYANDIFCKISGFREDEMIGKPHSLIRHPDMPRTVFKLLWETLKSKREIFAYVKNIAKDGGYYWVFAHVTPTLDQNGEIIGYHSNRRVPSKKAVAQISKIYEALLAEEKRHGDPKAGLAAGEALLVKTLADAGVTYDEFVWSLQE